MRKKKPPPASNSGAEGAPKGTPTTVTAPATAPQKGTQNPNVNHLAHLSNVPALPGWWISKAQIQLQKCYLCP